MRAYDGFYQTIIPAAVVQLRILPPPPFPFLSDDLVLSKPIVCKLCVHLVVCYG